MNFMKNMNNNNMKTLNEIAKDIHQEQVDMGFYDNERQLGTLLMLIVSELAEAMEADRRGDWININEIKKDVNDKEVFKKYIKDTFEDEIADTFIRLFDLCGYLDIDIDKHIQAKLNYNKSRGYRHGNKKY